MKSCEECEYIDLDVPAKKKCQCCGQYLCKDCLEGHEESEPKKRRSKKKENVAPYYRGGCV